MTLFHIVLHKRDGSWKFDILESDKCKTSSIRSVHVFWNTHTLWMNEIYYFHYFLHWNKLQAIFVYVETCNFELKFRSKLLKSVLLNFVNWWSNALMTEYILIKILLVNIIFISKLWKLFILQPSYNLMIKWILRLNYCPIAYNKIQMNIEYTRVLI